ncbi:5-methylcytosine-specific restriction enzyme A [Octadecabacter temperatus]|uniref:Uncharacterized protein n=1 Tax=Octadecabacter temperatus TaxID=1458307 RepID=A0A0K0Y1M6_9RHOB|nr:HNH endonuclease [Octadecabacter temperatus]AKS44844.1 hypothetical protein OSB_02760 [Octadecabacter temperatus]SIO34608.1 5-methylcytosine-specific restriction enzyme A [Octadecabacter temperatus]
MEYRYHRMAPNTHEWRKPNSGRLGKSHDYLGENGFGHEDWNFSRDVWQDGRCHLYLRQRPSKTDRSKRFCIALGDRTEAGHVLVGFAENVEFGISTLERQVWLRRARNILDLKKEDSLAGVYSALTNIDDIARALEDENEAAWVSVAPNDLLILDTPILIPSQVIGLNYKRYQLNKLTRTQYEALRSLTSSSSTVAEERSSDFPEGGMVEKVHRVRERDGALIRKAKEGFIHREGALFCEACGWRPDAAFGVASLKDTIIEAHHDVPLCAPEHTGTTKVGDLKMLCPNCHRAIHRFRPWLLVHEFRKRFFS